MVVIVTDTRQALTATQMTIATMKMIATHLGQTAIHLMTGTRSALNPIPIDTPVIATDIQQTDIRMTDTHLELDLNDTHQTVIHHQSTGIHQVSTDTRVEDTPWETDTQ